MTFLEKEMKNLAEAPRTHNTTSLLVPSSMSQTLLQTEEAFTVKEFKHTHTPTYKLLIEKKT